MFKLEGSIFEKTLCPSERDNKICDALNCIFAHSEKLKKKSEHEFPHRRLTFENIKDIEKPSSVTESSAFSLDNVTRDSHMRKIDKFFEERFPQDQQSSLRRAIKEEREIYAVSSSLEEYNALLKTLLGSRAVTDPKVFAPKAVANPPAELGFRLKLIVQLVKAYRQHHPDIQTPITRAIEEEYKVAKVSSRTTYSASIKKVIYAALHPEKAKTPKENGPTEEQYKRLLSELVIPVEKLEKFGFIMRSPETITPSRIRTCHRCGAEFTRDEQLSPVQCQYHAGRVRKTDFGRVYECCQSEVSSGDTHPCTVSNMHVFYWQNKEEMEWSIPFQNTDRLFGESKGSLFAIGIDCEMGYTTRGSELLRVTAVDFFSGKDVLDIFVRPYGEVVDLNTRYSGVSEIKPEAVSFHEMLNQLGHIMDKNTILVGHGLENDMNAMRLIHNRIIDTSILYPKHKATPTFKFSLKDLAFQYLSRVIQTGEHDSSEDSLAAIDIVKYFIKKDIQLQVSNSTGSSISKTFAENNSLGDNKNKRSIAPNHTTTDKRARKDVQ
ncbi:hypothetical protein G9P44_001692 [Scheffersomyces stipitis]|nr:hypothetical protein G9P44_001692 [Scheffersomyces stipitis]